VPFKRVSQVLLVFIFIQTSIQFADAGQISSARPELVVYAYDSFVAPGGLGAQIIPLFEEKYKCRVRTLNSGDGAQLLTRLELDAKRGKPTAQIVVGIDQQIWKSVQQWVEPWGDWTPVGYQNLIKIADTPGRGFLPYDYGVFALMMDRLQMEDLKIQIPPSRVLSIQELLSPRWKRNIILEDPRTSTPGLAFLIYSARVLENEVWGFWEKFRGQWLTLTPGWNAAYGLFLNKEAPLVWSYMTSQAYHQEKQESGEKGETAVKRKEIGLNSRYQAILFQEGQPYQVEGVALVKGAFQTQESRLLARKFLEFLISIEVQKMIPKKTWMMPVLRGVELPESFRDLPRPKKWIGTQIDPTEMKKLLSRWKEIVGRSF
jgi:thiamine transport system substrate-binding protein